jgi:hypothetical protein
MNIKSEVKIEDLFITQDHHLSNSNNNGQQQYALCSLCRGFANIYCVNCNNVWLCTEHWGQHKIDYHSQ